MKYQEGSTAHGVLEYLISRAMLQGKTGTSTVTVRMTDYEDLLEGPQFTEDAEDLVLKITMTTEWDGYDPTKDDVDIIDDEEMSNDGN